MKSSTSSLNPNAASYVPISKRELNEHKDPKTLPNAVSVVGLPTKDDNKLKNAADGVSCEYSQETDIKFMDEESEMDLAYLQMMFPGVSDQSVADVYYVNSGDLDSAVDMLTHLEAVDNIPDSLNIKHPEAPASSSEYSSAKGVIATGESSSSARPSDLAVAT
ncbi:polyadenylate-binding protein-interacting protein 6-like [Chenopodium quinoa]|uniref:polyadenylate-binding protein-interacting protein 6-like n=1 Tax=Chenopodium quinoa TaxID=63459 RepID=UPI000B77740D|nr:polyadenylate-binding protein-interacting protein 6-like [Chenopodium quinoa]